MLEKSHENLPPVLWLTGLSGAGKTTLAQRVAERLRVQGHRVEELDGDRLREIFPNTGFAREDRIAHVARAGRLARQLQLEGATVIASLISPYRESRDQVRDICDRFFEIYVSTPLAVCERRDVKGLYARARKGEILNFTGVSDPYEPPLSPELSVDTSNKDVDECVAQIVGSLEKAANSTAN